MTSSTRTNSFAKTERAALLALLHQLGPGAPTLCEGWTTHDLAAHLVVRDGNLLAQPGFSVPALHGISARIEARARRTPYDELLARLEKGPPVWSPTGLPGPLYEVVNLSENFIHHEDVRRCQADEPRNLPALEQDALWSRLRALGVLTGLRSSGLGIVVESGSGSGSGSGSASGVRSQRLRRGEETVTVRGPVGELVLWLSGRKGAAAVELAGSPAAVEKARSATFSL